jgi:hypothetical protein
VDFYGRHLRSTAKRATVRYLVSELLTRRTQWEASGQPPRASGQVLRRFWRTRYPRALR